MDTSQIIQIINATSANVSTLISQVAWFFAIQSAAHWLSFTLPCLLMFSVLLRLAKTSKTMEQVETAGRFVLFAWIFFAASLYTGVRGLAHVAQAAVAPTVYVASEIGEIGAVVSQITKK